MNTDPQPPTNPSPGQPFWRVIIRWPSTKLGWWSVGLGVTFAELFFINSIIFMPLAVEEPWRQTLLPLYGIFMLLCGLAAGIVGLVAVIRRGERSLLVWLAILPGMFVFLFLVGEFLAPH
jgi:hypothetical protein